MYPIRARLWKIAGLLLCSALLALAQNWQTATTLPGIDFSGLTPAQKATALKLLRENKCGCQCGMTIAQCRFADPSCSYSQGLASVIIDSLRHGKTAKEALAAANASEYAHLIPQKLLDNPVAIPTDHSPSVGPANAPITLVEFSDFQCPYCAAAVPQIKAILKAYPSQARLFFKEYPLDFHPQAGIAAEAAVAAQKQGKFWAMHDAMYAHPDRLSRQDLMADAKKLGLNMQQFETDLNSAGVKQIIMRDIKEGDRAGVQGTPTLFINGQRYNGPLEADILKPILSKQLKKAQAGSTVAAVR